jgi:hypothetical protein
MPVPCRNNIRPVRSRPRQLDAQLVWVHQRYGSSLVSSATMTSDWPHVFVLAPTTVFKCL